MDDPVLEEWSPGSAPPPTTVAVPTTPLGLPLAAARNAGVERALAAGAETIVCLDVDCIAGPALVAAYAEAVAARPDVVWAGPVTYLSPAPSGGYDLDGLDALDDPHPGRPAPAPGQQEIGADPTLFWSLSFALHRDAWAATGGFCEDYVGYGGEDTDFGQLVVSSGLELGWTGSARAYHQHHEVHDPPIEHVDDILRNGRIFHDRWGWWPMTGWLEEFEERGLVERDGVHWRRTVRG
jgi:GT2 family glycosyltransferase